MRKNDIVDIVRYTFSIFMFITMIRKLFFPIYKVDYIESVTILNPSMEIISIYLWYFIILCELLFIIGLYNDTTFNISIFIGILLISIGIIISILGIILNFESNCGCGLFGDVPQLLLTQKLILLFLLGFLYKNKKSLFNEKKPV